MLEAAFWQAATAGSAPRRAAATTSFPDRNTATTLVTGADPCMLKGIDRPLLEKTMLRRIPAIVSLSCWAALAGAEAPPLPAASRGELLYSTHCIACHNEQMHWRTLHQARDWDTLRAQVRRWQANAGLGWPDADVDAVARYLNDTIYGFPRPPVASTR